MIASHLYRSITPLVVACDGVHRVSTLGLHAPHLLPTTELNITLLPTPSHPSKMFDNGTI